MIKHFVLTVITDDRPGVAEKLADTINRHGGNWLESRMAHMAGKFAGILHCSVAEEESEALRNHLQALNEQGFAIVVEEGADSAAKTDQMRLHFSVVGNDRPGIVREITQAFAQRQINLEELHSAITNAPHAGIPLFEAEGLIFLPQNADQAELEAKLDTISDDLTVDIQLEEPQ